jgi:antitoxin ParD1/3/4
MAISADIGPQLESYIETLIAKGRYNSKSEVVREGIRLVQEREAKLAVLDVRQGRTISAELVFDRLEAKYAAMIKRDVA